MASTLPAGGNHPGEENPNSLNHRRRAVPALPEQEQGQAAVDAVSPSPRQLEEAATEAAEFKEKVKTQNQLAIALLTFSAGAVISAKGTTFGHQPAQAAAAAGGQALHQFGFFFWASITSWLTCLLFSLFVALVTALLQESPGLASYAKFINNFTICLIAIGVVFWILS